MIRSRVLWLRRLLSADFVRGVLLISGGTAIAQAIPVVLTPVLTRLYSPQDMGVLALYVAFISFCANATTLGYSMAIVSGQSEREGGLLTLVSAIAVVPMATVFSVLFAGLVQFDVLGFGALSTFSIAAMWVSLVLTGMFFTLRYWLVRCAAYGMVSQATVTQSFGRIGMQVLAGWGGLGWSGLILGEVIGRGSGMVRLWRASRPTLSNACKDLTSLELQTVAVAYKKFPLLSAPSSALNSLALVLPIPLITMHYGLFEAGQFSVAYRVLGLPLSLIGASVADVFHTRISRLSRERPEQGIRFFMQVAGALLVIALVPLLVVSLFAQQLFISVLGSNWGISGLVAGAIVPWVLMEFIVGPLSRVVLVYRGQELKLVYDVLALLSIIGGISLGAQQGWSFIETCRLLAWTQSIVYGVYFVLLLRILYKHNRINFVEHEENGRR